MKAFLLAAGKGTRLRPFTDHTPKCLMPIRGEPLLGIWLQHCRAHGVTDVLVNTHHKASQVREYVKNHSFGVRITTVFEETLLGSAGTVLANRNFVHGEESFFILYGDNLTNADLMSMATFHSRHSGILTMGLTETDRPRECGIACPEADGRITSFVEKPSHPQSNLANAGIYISRREIFDYIPEQGAADFGFDVLPQIVGKMVGYRISGTLIDIGTPESYRRANAEWGISCSR